MINRRALNQSVRGALWLGKILTLGIIGVGIVAVAGVGAIMLLNSVATSIGGTTGILASMGVLILLFMILAGIAIYFIEARRL